MTELQDFEVMMRKEGRFTETKTILQKSKE